MRFSKISITKSGVHLVRVIKDQKGGVESTDYTSPEGPLSTFADAMQAFGSYVNDLLDVPEVWRDKLRVTTVNLSESKDGRRGLQVSVSYAVAKADDKVVSLTTPIVHEASENGTGTSFTLSDAHFALIDLLEQEATRYANGEREQGELFAKAETTSENAKAFDDRAASAEVTSTRKPRRPKKGEAVGDTWNPDATVAVTDAKLQELLAAVGKTVPIDAISRWASSERDNAQRWAESSARGVASSIPLCVQRDSMRSLTEQASSAHVQ